MNRKFKLAISTLAIAFIMLCASPIANYFGVDMPDVFFPQTSANSAELSGECGDHLTWSLDEKTGILDIVGFGLMDDYTSSANAPWYDYREIIKTVIMPSKIYRIGHFAFDGCIFLDNIEFSEKNDIENQGDYIINDGVFDGTFTQPYIYSENPDDIAETYFKTATNNKSYSQKTRDIIIDVIKDNSDSDSTPEIYVNVTYQYKFRYIIQEVNDAGIGTGTYRYTTLEKDIVYSIFPEGALAHSDGSLISCCIKYYPLYGTISNPARDIITVNNFDDIPINVFIVKQWPMVYERDKYVEMDFYSLDSKEKNYQCELREIHSSHYDLESNPEYCVKTNARINLTTENKTNEEISGVSFRVCAGVGERIRTELIRKGIPKGSGIGECAFNGCSSLNNIIIPENITTICNYAFSGCDNLISITVPDIVKSISEYAFYGVGNINYHGPAICDPRDGYWGAHCLNGCVDGNFVFKDNTKKTLVFFSRSFYGKIDVPKGVTTIDSCAFARCHISEVTIPDSVIIIENSAFEGCNELTNILIPDGVFSIRGRVFYNCANLANITIPNSVTRIGEKAFYGCTGLTELTIPASAKIDNSQYTFYNCSNIEKVTFTKGTGKMQDYEMSLSSSSATYYQYTPWYISRKTMKEVIIEDGVTHIGSNVFRACLELINIIIPDSITSIGSSAFYNCIKFTNITIPNGVTSIGEYAFYGCSELSNISIPDSVTNLGEYAFCGCSNINVLNIGNGITQITNDMFEGCNSISAISLGNSLNYIASNAFTNTAFYNNSENWNNGVLYIGDYIIKANADDILNDYIVKDGTIAIASNAFTDCIYLKNIVIPEGVSNINSEAFSGCIRLSSATIPKSVTEIGANAFNNCTSLDDVYYPGTEAEWRAITVGVGNDYLISANIHYNESGYHICDFSILAYYQAEHPHYAVYKCECGKEQVSTETTNIVSCNICNHSSDNQIIPQDKAKIPKVSTSTIDYGDSIVLHFNTDVALPARAKIVWSADNGNFSYTVSADGKTCTITPQKSGDTTFSAKVVDANGKAISEEYTQKMTSKAGFLQKLVAFFKKLFGATKIIAQTIKYDF